MEANGVAFVISIIAVTVVQKLVSHFGHPLVEVIILNIPLSVFLSTLCVSRWQGRSIPNLWWPNSSILSLDCSYVLPNHMLLSSLISYPPIFLTSTSLPLKPWTNPSSCITGRKVSLIIQTNLFLVFIQLYFISKLF